MQKRLAVAQTELEEKHADDIKKAREEGAADAAASLAQQTEEISQLEAKIAKLEAEKAKLSNTALMEFRMLCNQLQETNIKIEKLIDETHKKDAELSLKMGDALRHLLTDEFRYF